MDPRVAGENDAVYDDGYGTLGNRPRSHRFGWQAEEAVDIARNQIADLVGADPREIVFTSGATESDNGDRLCSQLLSEKGKHIITSKTEHKAVLDTSPSAGARGFESLTRHRSVTAIST